MTGGPRLSRVLDHSMRVPVAIGAAFIVGAGIGIGVGYLLGKRRKKVDDTSSQKLNDYYGSKRDIGLSIIEDPNVPDDVIITFPENDGPHDFIATRIDGPIAPKLDPDPELVSRSVFAATSSDGEWDYREELKTRTPDAPFIIHKDEFFGEEADYTQMTLTYYAGDDILCDENNKPIYNHEDVTGPLRFGHGSDDSGVVYVRNDKHQAEYEILLEPGLYSEEVLHLRIEDNQRARDVKHSAANRRFRPE